MIRGIGLDIGSTNVKAALVDESGELLASATRPLATELDGTHAEQDPEDIWLAVLETIRELGARNDLTTVAAIGIDSQYSSIVPVAADATPVGPCVLYLDHRGTDHSHAIFARHDDAFMVWIERHGIPPVGNGLSLAHILHFQHDRPEVHARTHAYLEVMDYVAARLTGIISATQCTMFTSQLCDNRTLGVTEYDADLVKMSGIDADRLPPLRAPDGALGPLLDQVADDCGLPRGVSLATPMNDSQAGAYATDAFSPGTVGVMIGTTGVILDIADDKDADYERELLTMPASDGHHHLVWAENGLAGRAVAHVLESIVHAADVVGDHATADPFAHIDSVLSETEPGAGGLLFLPWLAGSMSPAVDPQMRGGFVGISLSTTRLDLVRAAIEGTAHNLAWLLAAVERFTSHRADLVTFGGGAARSSGWAQVLADVLDRPVRPLADPAYAVARTVGALALERTGHAKGVSVARFSSRTYEPRTEFRERYAAQQRRFEATFDALRPIWQAG